MSTQTVIKRDGTEVEVDFNEINTRQIVLTNKNNCLSEDPLVRVLNVNTITITQKTIEELYPGINTSELDGCAANVCSNYMSINPDYGILGGRLLCSNLRKNLKTMYDLTKYSDKVKYFSENLPEFLNKDYIKFVEDNKDTLDNFIVYDRDYILDFFGFKTLEASYLHKINGTIFETPQDMWMRVAVGIHCNITTLTTDEKLDRIKKIYDCLSCKYYIHATPTLFNAGTSHSQLSSCFLIGTDDSLEGITDTWKSVSKISKFSGGIGLHISNIRAGGAPIKSTNGQSTGIVPMLKVYNEIAKYINQGGKRPGSFAIYLETWHADIMEFLELKLPSGADDIRARYLHYALWIDDLFMKQVESKGDWYLMSPDQSIGLSDLYGEEFEERYWEYVKQGKYFKKISADKLWEKILICLVETGVPYILSKDNVNRKNNHSNLGTIKSSNLCAEIVQYSDHKEHAVCNLASIALNMYYENGVYNFKKLEEVAGMVCESLNYVIDVNFYPTKEAEYSSKTTRAIGIGIQGFADLLYMMELPFESQEAVNLNKLIMETIYYGAVKKSIELAKRDGPYERIKGSIFEEGKLQFDLWDAIDSDRYNWNVIKDDLKRYGIRNSMITALMPTASTAQILGNIECFEPATSNLYTRKTLAGTFMIPNKHLIKALQKENLWNLDMKTKLIDHRGSVQNITEIPDKIKMIYKTAWEVKQRAIIDHAAARGPFVDQSQSMNLFIPVPTYDRITSCLFYGWKKGLKTLCYYLRSQPSVAPQQITQEVKKNDNKKDNQIFCSLANPGACISCSG